MIDLKTQILGVILYCKWGPWKSKLRKITKKYRNELENLEFVLQNLNNKIQWHNLIYVTNIKSDHVKKIGHTWTVFVTFYLEFPKRRKQKPCVLSMKILTIMISTSWCKI